MAKYRVLRAVEHNRKLYLPATAVSAADGTQIEVDSSGFIQLSEDEASQFGRGQIEPAEQASVSESSSSSGSSKKSSSKS